ncbi:hypothetical protein [Sphingopyxis sp.]
MRLSAALSSASIASINVSASPIGSASWKSALTATNIASGAVWIFWT